MADNHHQIYRLDIEVLSPLHIGTGNILRRDFEFGVHDNQTWVIDTDALASEILDRGAASAQWQSLLAGRPAVELLDADDYQPDGPLIRYSMRGTPKAQATGSEIREMIKDAWDRPYLPGSSLKGALRTAFIVDAFEELGMTVDLNDLEDRPKFAARNIERSIVAPRSEQRRAPNNDIFKALQVSDSGPDTQKRMALITGAVYAGKETSIPVALECMPRGATVSATLTLDQMMLDRYGPERLNWDRDKQVKWIKNLRLRANKLAYRHIQAELRYWTERGIQGLADFYRLRFAEMRKLRDEKDRTTFYMQVGWGTGWSSKTLGHILTADGANFYRIVKRYGRTMDLRGNYQQGEAFPRSRKIVVEDDRMVAPFGWVRVTMDRVK